MIEPSKEALEAAREWLLSPGGMHEENVQSLAALLDAHFATGEARGLGLAADQIPSNWVDGLLTGSDATLHGPGGTWGCPDIERLLGAIRQRIRALKPEGRPR